MVQNTFKVMPNIKHWMALTPNILDKDNLPVRLNINDKETCTIAKITSAFVAGEASRLINNLVLLRMIIRHTRISNIPLTKSPHLSPKAESNKISSSAKKIHSKTSENHKNFDCLVKNGHIKMHNIKILRSSNVCNKDIVGLAKRNGM